jgi:thioredoxin-related protein
VTGYPATYFMKPDAEMLGGVPGFIRPPDFMVYSRYVATRWYQKGGIKDYVDSLRTAAQ